MIIISKISYYYYLKDMLCNCYSLYRLKLVVHCIRHPELLANDLVAWEPDARRGETRRGRPVNVTKGCWDKHIRGTVNPDAGQGYMEEDICSRSDVAPN